MLPCNVPRVITNVVQLILVRNIVVALSLQIFCDLAAMQFYFQKISYSFGIDMMIRI